MYSDAYMIRSIRDTKVYVHLLRGMFSKEMEIIGNCPMEKFEMRNRILLKNSSVDLTLP